MLFIGCVAAAIIVLNSDVLKHAEPVFRPMLPHDLTCRPLERRAEQYWLFDQAGFCAPNLKTLLPDYLLPLLHRTLRTSGPQYDVLLDMAIGAKRPDDVLRWDDKMPKGQNTLAADGVGGGGCDDRVAAAVAKSHPERALEIYRRNLDGPCRGPKSQATNRRRRISKGFNPS